MGCNAWNHPLNCTCGWGGDGHLGKGGRNSFRQKHLDYKESTESTISKDSSCRPSRCPICSCQVFFIKHNGGSVWLDPPLSPPWYLHPCFENDKSTHERVYLEAKASKNNISKLSSIGVVTQCEYSDYYYSTKISMESGNKIIVFECRGDAKSLNGQLCIYDPSQRQAWGFYKPQKKYNCIGLLKELDRPKKQKKEPKKEKEIKNKEECVICKVKLKPSEPRIIKHYRKVHKCLVLTSLGEVTGTIPLETD